MKVLVVQAKTPIYGGAEKVIHRLLTYMDSKGINCFLVMPEAIGPLKELPNMIATGSYIHLWRAVQDLSKEFDVLNIHNFPATLTTFPKPKPAVWMCNEPAEMFTTYWRKPLEWANRWIVRKYIDEVVVADTYNSRRVREIYKVDPQIIPYGIDYKTFSTVDRGNSKGKDRSIILQIGTLTPYKNQIESLKIALMLKHMGFVRFELRFLTLTTWNSAYTKLIMQVISDLGLAGNVVILREWNEDLVKDELSRCDVLLHPVKPQGGWLVPFEAICARVPVVVSKEFTNADFIKNNRLGEVASTTLEYAEAIKKLLLSKTPKEELERRAMWVRDNLSWDTYCSRMVALFERVARHRGK
jgi:glycosyltransferase involved in cell wall biosynthesis